MILALTGAALLLSGCSEAAPPREATAVASTVPTTQFKGPSGLEVESEQAARAHLEAQRRAAEEARRQAEAAAMAEAAAAAQAAAEAAAAEAAAAQAAEAEAARTEDECFGYGCSPEQDAEINDLESRCADGTATIEECFGPGADENGNGIADVNE